MIYLDNNATTPLADEVWAAMEPFVRGHFSNPSSASTLARPVKRAIAEARESCAALLGCDVEEILFTSGGTEALNTALHSVTRQQPQRKHLILGSTEHEAVRNPVAWLVESEGYTVSELPVNPAGQIAVADVAAAIRPGETAAIFLMAANNETGVLSPLPEVAALAAAHGIPLITDLVQMAGKCHVSLADTGVSLAAISGHKIHGPKGIGALYVNRHMAFLPWMRGGNQERQRRAGTENTAGIVGLGAAARLASAALAQSAVVAAMRDFFEAEILRRIPASAVNGAGVPRVPNTTNLRIDGVVAEGLLFLLDQRGVIASAGSACTTGSTQPSHVLTAMGLTAEQAKSSLRFSFSRYQTRTEVERAVDVVVASVEKFRTLMGWSSPATG